MLRRKWQRIIGILRYVFCISIILLCFWFYKEIKSHKNEVMGNVPKNAMKYIDYEPKHNMKPLSIKKTRQFITLNNARENIENLDVYGRIKSETFIFVISVNKYKISLKYLILSLSRIEGIEDALLIFSHSVFDLDVNILISTIDFARVLHVYYPFSLQLYTDKFPGFSLRDCPRDMTFDEAERVQCIGADTPDLHGRYRDPAQSEKKHFWWWTMNKVFENLTHTRHHKGLFTFLEDDMFLTEDFIYMSLHMKTVSQYVSPCDFLSLERLVALSGLENENSYSVEVKSWDPKSHSNVLIFDMSTWNIIVSHYYLFCNFEDYTWSRSLYYLSLNRKDGDRFKVMTSALPRAFKISAGMHKQFHEYNIYDTIYHIMELQRLFLKELFPSHLEVHYNVELDYDEFLGFDDIDNSGGWSDPRDKMMCSNLTINKIKKVLMDMHNEFNEYNIKFV